jgi:ABC-type glycerol-3-phosphate transport system permease component
MSEGFEPEVRKYLFKILNSLCIGLLWLSLNVLSGLYWGYGIVKGKFSVSNVLFFIWFVLSLSALLYYYYRTWRKYF